MKLVGLCYGKPGLSKVPHCRRQFGIRESYYNFSSGYSIVVLGMDASESPADVDNSSRSMNFERSSRFCSLNISRQPDIHVPSPFIGPQATDVGDYQTKHYFPTHFRIFSKRLFGNFVG